MQRRLFAAIVLCLACTACATRPATVSLRDAAMQTLPLRAAAAARELPARSYRDASADYAYDLYLPVASVAPPRLILLIHGGAPAASGLRGAPLMRSWATQIVAHTGAAVAAIGWDGHLRDTAQIGAAYAHLRAHAGEYGIDAARPCVITFSAGVAAVVPYALRDTDLRPRCLVGYYGDWQPATEALDGVDAAGLPILVVRAGRDEVVPDLSAPAFVDAARQSGARVRVLRQPSGLHAFEVRNPDDATVRILEQTLDFLKTESAAKP
ncbi:MAG TPA: alpha/beta hydrolase [Luteimonas sp.]|nr:alpha/beta hydrolase [Luteimonas sp.]